MQIKKRWASATSAKTNASLARARSARSPSS